MKISGKGNNNNGIFSKWLGRLKTMQDPRVPKYLSKKYKPIIKIPASEQIEYLNKVVNRYIGEVKDFQDLGKLTVSWAKELYAIKPERPIPPELPIHDVDLLLKKEDKLIVLASSREINPQELKLDEPDSVVSWTMKQKDTVFIPDIYTKYKIPPEYLPLEKTIVTDYVVMTVDEKGKSVVYPLSKTGINLNPLTEGEKCRNCLLISPLISGEKTFGVLFQEFGIPNAFYYTPDGTGNAAVSGHLAKTIAFGIDLLLKKGLSF
jgi:hypothetical protein